jgi:hypothetical protein
MLYPVTIKDKFGKVKRVVPTKELNDIHWSNFTKEPRFARQGIHTSLPPVSISNITASEYMGVDDVSTYMSKLRRGMKIDTL